MGHIAIQGHIIREGDVAFLREGEHYVFCSWRFSLVSTKRKLLYLSPDANWETFDGDIARYLDRLGISLNEGKCYLCPPGLTLTELLGG